MTDRRSASHAGEPTLPNDEREQETNRQFEHELAAAHASQLSGDIAGARDLIERALRYKPRDQRARNLLGLTLFKLGELARAEAIYRGLIEDHPADPTLRVNLGLVFLKHGASADAARCFTTALDLQPEHTKAQNYLGLALAQKGEHLQARDWFILAGNAAMAERMDGLLAAAGYRERAPPQVTSMPIGRAQVEAIPATASTLAPKAMMPEPPEAAADASDEESHLEAASATKIEIAPLSDPQSVATALSTPDVFGAARPPEEAPIDRGPVESRHDSGSTSEFSRPILPQGWNAQTKSPSASESSAPAEAAAPDATAQRERTEREAAKTDPTLTPVSFAEAGAAASSESASTASSGSAQSSVPAASPAATTAAAAEPVATNSAAEPETAKLSAYTNERRLAVPRSESSFAIGQAEVVVQVHGEMLTRLDGLVASWGTAAIRSELKRFRGKATDKTFGEGSRRMLRATGEGRYVISREGRTFTALELGDEPAYFREEVLFAFEESLTFENGRVPSKLGSDLHLVHLRGRGRLLLVSSGAPRAVEVRKGEPLRIPMDQLIGWHGPLIQPRVVPIVEEAPEFGVALELSGEGRALVDAPHA